MESSVHPLRPLERALGRRTAATSDASAPGGFTTHPQPVFRGDHVWAMERDDLGVQYLVRYRIAMDPRAD